MSTSTEHDQLPSPAPSSDPLSQLQRLVIVSNRLPVTCVKQKDGGWTYNKSSGGLVTALSGIKNTSRFVWIGWPGVHVDDEAERREMERKLFEEYSCIPVWMDFELMEDFYNGMPLTSCAGFRSQCLLCVRAVQASRMVFCGRCSTTSTLSNSTPACTKPT
jgi:hypothetical protein